MASITQVITPLDLVNAINGASEKSDTALQPSDIVSTYSAIGTLPVNGTAVAGALATLDIPVIDQTYSASSTNAQSGTAIAFALSGKQDTISDLSTIRSGAELGATALQISDVISTYSASGTLPVNGTAVASALSTLDIPLVDISYNASSTNAQSGTAIAGALDSLIELIPDVDQTYSAFSTNAQSGTAIAGALANVLPSQSGNSGKYLSTDGTITSWETVNTSMGINTLSSSGSVSLTDNSVNSITPTGNVTFTLPAISDNTIFHQILVQVKLTSQYDLTLGTSYYFDSTVPVLSTVGSYNLFYEYDSLEQHWVVGATSKGASS